MSCAIVSDITSGEYDGLNCAVTVHFVCGQDAPMTNPTSFEVVVLLPVSQSESNNKSDIKNAIVDHALAHGIVVNNILFPDLTYLAV